MSEIKTPVRHGSADRWTIFDANGEHVLDSWATSDMRGEQVAAAVVTALNSLAALVEALRAARRELNCLIDQATARGYTSGGPLKVVEQINEALKGTQQ